MNEQEGRRPWLNATERFVLWCGVGPVFVSTAPAALAILGPLRGTAALVLSFGAALLWFEALFRRWRKVPFACSYLPAKKPLVIVLVRYAFAAPLLVPISQMVLYSSGDLVAFLALLTFEAVLWRHLRQTRQLTTGLRRLAPNLQAGFEFLKVTCVEFFAQFRRRGILNLLIQANVDFLHAQIIRNAVDGIAGRFECFRRKAEFLRVLRLFQQGK